MNETIIGYCEKHISTKETILPVLNAIQEAPRTGEGYADPVPRNISSIAIAKFRRVPALIDSRVN